MNDETKKQINERYERKLEKGERFWPDTIFKDVVMSLDIFVLLLLLATFVGIPAEAKADPSDTSYIPRPEWYFLFLFKFLALYGQLPLIGKIEWLATVLVPTIALGVLTLIPFIEKSPHRPCPPYSPWRAAFDPIQQKPPAPPLRQTHPPHFHHDRHGRGDRFAHPHLRSPHRR